MNQPKNNHPNTSHEDGPRTQSRTREMREKFNQSMEFQLTQPTNQLNFDGLTRKFNKLILAQDQPVQEEVLDVLGLNPNQQLFGPCNDLYVH